MLKFIEFNENDYELLVQVFQNDEVMKYALDDCYSDEELHKYHNRILANNKSGERKQYEYKVYADNVYIGFADFEIIRKMKTGGIAEIGYFLLPDFWGKGYGTLIAGELIRICFNDLGLHKVIASCNIENTGSWKIMEKAGMIREGEFTAHRYKNGKFITELKYGLINKLFLDE